MVNKSLKNRHYTKWQEYTEMARKPQSYAQILLKTSKVKTKYLLFLKGSRQFIYFSIVSANLKLDNQVFNM